MKPPPPSLWERFSKVSLSSEDLGLEDHLLPDLSSDPDINHEVPLINDDELLKPPSHRSDQHQNPTYDRLLWNQRALDDRNYLPIFFLFSQKLIAFNNSIIHNFLILKN